MKAVLEQLPSSIEGSLLEQVAASDEVLKQHLRQEVDAYNKLNSYLRSPTPPPLPFPPPLLLPHSLLLLLPNSSPSPPSLLLLLTYTLQANFDEHSWFATWSYWGTAGGSEEGGAGPSQATPSLLPHPPRANR